MKNDTDNTLKTIKNLNLEKEKLKNERDEKEEQVNKWKKEVKNSQAKNQFDSFKDENDNREKPVENKKSQIIETVNADKMELNGEEFINIWISEIEDGIKYNIQWLTLKAAFGSGNIEYIKKWLSMMSQITVSEQIILDLRLNGLSDSKIREIMNNLSYIRTKKFILILGNKNDENFSVPKNKQNSLKLNTVEDLCGILFKSDNILNSIVDLREIAGEDDFLLDKSKIILFKALWMMLNPDKVDLLI